MNSGISLQKRLIVQVYPSDVRRRPR